MKPQSIHIYSVDFVLSARMQSNTVKVFLRYHKAHCRHGLVAAAGQITYDTELALPKENINEVMIIDAEQSGLGGYFDH